MPNDVHRRAVPEETWVLSGGDHERAPVKIVSVMTTDAAGGAEFAAVEMLDALAASGHDVVMLSDQSDIGRQTRVVGVSNW